MKEETKSLFSAVMKHGGVFHSPHLSVKCLPSQDGSVRVVASKKNIATAVSRNQFKRRIRAIFNENDPLLKAIVFAKAGAGKLTGASLKEEVESLISKATAPRI